MDLRSLRKYLHFLMIFRVPIFLRGDSSYEILWVTVNHVYLNLFFFANWFFRKICTLSLIYIFLYFFFHICWILFFKSAQYFENNKIISTLLGIKYQFHIFFHHFCVFQSIQVIFTWNNINTLIKTNRNIFFSAFLEIFVQILAMFTI